MARFLSDLVVSDITDDIWRLHDPLLYDSDIMGRIRIPGGFYTDLASVPRVPLVFEAFGNKCHYEATVHDFLYRKDAGATFDQANDVFLEAMAVRGKPWYIRYPMYWGVCLGGRTSYHKRMIADKIS